MRVFHVADGWDGTAPLPERALRFHSGPQLCARPEELPVVTAESRERIRRGWGL